MFARVGKECWIEPPINFAYGTHISIGDNFYANFNLTLVDDAEITIGNNVMFAPNVTISTAGHPIHPDLRHTQQQFSLPVVIEDGVWLGTGVIINPGVPCRVLRDITDEDKNKYQLFAGWTSIIK